MNGGLPIEILLLRPSAELGVHSMISDLNNALLSAHRANLDRYRRLLRTYLTDSERQFVERRIAEERQALQQLADGNALDSVA